MGRTGRADGWRHDRDNALAGDGKRGQGRAIRHRGGHRVIRRQEGQRGWRKLVARGARRSAQPCTPYNLLADTTQLAGCGGKFGGRPGCGPDQPADSFGIASFSGREPLRARKAQKQARNERVRKNLWCVRSGRCQVLPPGGLLTCRDRCFLVSRQPCCLPYGSDRPAGDRRTGPPRL